MKGLSWSPFLRFSDFNKSKNKNKNNDKNNNKNTNNNRNNDRNKDNNYNKSKNKNNTSSRGFRLRPRARNKADCGEKQGGHCGGVSFLAQNCKTCSLCKVPVEPMSQTNPAAVCASYKQLGI